MIRANGHYEVKTPTAKASASGDLVVVANTGAGVTQFTSVQGRSTVESDRSGKGRSVSIDAGERTRVSRGRRPVKAENVKAPELARLAAGFDLKGTGRRDGLNVLHPLVTGKLVDADDSPRARTGRREKVGIGLSAPLGSLAETLAPDVRVNTQPLIEFRRLAPGAKGSGQAQVNF